MILAIDIGNTTTNFGIFEKGKLKSQFSIATQSFDSPRRFKALAKTQKLHLSRAAQILICSVVPRMTAALTESLKSLAGIPIRIVGQDITVPLKNKYKYPEQVGQDRLVGAYAAWCAYGAPRRRAAGRSPERPRKRTAREWGHDVIVADFGTAITIDLVTKAGEYLGGIIAPGLEISLEALAAKTALLPKVELKEPPELLGRDTANSIRSGLLYGCVALTDGLVGQLKAKYAKQAVVVATGGASALIARHAKSITHLKPHLVLEGLYQLSLF